MGHKTVSDAPFGFCPIRENAFVPLVPLDLAMRYSFLLLLPLSMFPWLGSLLQHGGIWLFGKLMVSCIHLPLLRVHCLLLVLILSKFGSPLFAPLEHGRFACCYCECALYMDRHSFVAWSKYCGGSVFCHFVYAQEWFCQSWEYVGLSCFWW